MNARTIREQRRSAGLTLVEVLVVLFLLALLAQTAVLATEGLVEQGQRDATARSLEGIEEAVLGVPSRVDSTGRTLIRGFVADIGRLPKAPPPPALPAVWDPAKALQELWAVDDVFPRFGAAHAVAPAGDAEVRVLCGWRGPYLRLGFERSQLLDGWGRAFDCLRNDGTTAIGPSEQIDVVRSKGADGALGAAAGGPHDPDIVLTLRGLGPPSSERHTGRVEVLVNLTAVPNSTLLARIYGPEDGVAGTIDQESALVTGTGRITVPLPLLECSIGPRVLVVYHRSASSDLAEDAPVADVLAGHRRVVPIVVEPGGIPAITVEMP